MKKMRLGGRTLSIYDDIEELPITRFHKFSKMLLLDSGIGSDLQGFVRRMERAKEFVSADMKDSALKEIDNAVQSVMLVFKDVNPKHLAFAVLVAEVDGKPREDLSDGGLRETLEMIDGMTEKELESALSEAKKKIDAELTGLFPATFSTATEKEMASEIRRRAIGILEAIQKGEEIDTSKSDRRLLGMRPPVVFTGEKGAEAAHEKGFHDMCLLLSQELHVDPRTMNTYEFYNAGRYLNERNKERKKAMRNGRQPH